MPVIPLNDDYSNIPEFINSLFDKDVRNLDIIKKAIEDKSFFVAFSDQGDKILKTWVAAWQFYSKLPYDRNDFAHCPESDRAVIAFFSQFIFRNNISMFVPNLKYLGKQERTELPVYQLNGYTYLPFVENGRWVPDNVHRLLELLMLGAHFVFIQYRDDLPPGVSVESYYECFRNSPELKPYRRRDPGNSHYTSLVNICGYYVPKIKSNTAPDPCPFMLAYLVGPTDSCVLCRPKVYSTFMQLEGWEALHARHNADYDTHKKTLWNISTFGASVYSEKRGTTVFLAPGSWKPETNPDTIMPPYAGAETRQGWLNADLIRLG